MPNSLKPIWKLKNKLPAACFAIWEKVAGTVDEHRLFSPEDALVVGVSGGRDSMALLKWL